MSTMTEEKEPEFSQEFIDRMNGEDSIESFTPQCKKCANYIENADGGYGTCIGGFGTAIPMDVYLGDVIHNVYIEGDNGTKFIPVLPDTLNAILQSEW